ncbi:iron chelate uptake ABC transporter family permease subunit [Paenibacillus sp. Leaf72]|uniref:iron chelate uptake ABC transporter family permease subunit n=1 Tax=Paenibacillus sp. Leaf72 TaxID=1736234 RepID=UPI000701B4ED|nr:iron chelate uptake ABC transporter family permease subunit [Paenibacillus sp. Leaf72]KQO14156.1 hypothetical protein ASF12_29610 [Paenibacillus sp. Leaf72]
MTTRTKANPLFVSALFILGPILVIACFAWSLSTGPMGFTLNDFKQAILVKYWEADAYVVLTTLRLPNTIAIALAGAALACSAAMLQGLTRNRLAAPTTFGLTEMASLSLLVTWSSITSMQNSISVSTLTVATTMVGCILGYILLYAVVRLLKISTSSIQLILAGAFIGTAAHFILALLYMLNRFSEEATISSIRGHGIFKGESYTLAFVIIAALIAATLMSSLISKHYNNERSAGVIVHILSTVIITIMTGIAVWFVGPVACVGFASSVLLSKWCGNNYSIIIPGSAIIGAIILLLANIFSKSLSPIFEMPLAQFTNVFAIPLFIVMLWSYYRKKKALLF